MTFGGNSRFPVPWETAGNACDSLQGVTSTPDDPPLLANGLPRPEPPPTLRERVEALTAQVTDRLESRREPRPAGLPPRAENRPVLVTILAAVTAAIATVAVVWLWQSWATRPAATIDELIPLAEPVGQPTSSAESTNEAAPAIAAATEPDTVGEGAPDRSQPTSDPAAGVAVPADVTTRSARATEQIAVHIAGAVVEPGVVYLPPGSRVIDAVLAGGGAATTADLDRLNLAVVVEDGQQIYVPRTDEEVPETAANSRVGAALLDHASELHAASPTPALIDLNRATELELQNLPGIGPTMAAAIVGYRESVGEFVAVDELANVSGIGPTRLETLRPLVTVDGAPA